MSYHKIQEHYQSLTSEQLIYEIEYIVKDYSVKTTAARSYELTKSGQARINIISKIMDMRTFEIQIKKDQRLAYLELENKHLKDEIQLRKNLIETLEETIKELKK
jgi:predicted transcriptional regulator